MTAKLLVPVVALALFVAGCGDDGDDAAPDDDTTTTVADATTTAPEATTTAAPATTTTAAAATTTAAPEANPLLETARSVAGSWTGSWTNTTFGSTGPIEGELVLDEAAMTLTVTSDVGGFVFGAADPDPEILVLPLEAGEQTGSSPTFGDWTLTISEDGSFAMVATNLPAIPPGTFTLEGALTATGIEGTYTVDFGDGSAPAEGVITITQS